MTNSTYDWIQLVHHHKLCVIFLEWCGVKCECDIFGWGGGWPSETRIQIGPKTQELLFSYFQRKNKSETITKNLIKHLPDINLNKWILCNLYYKIASFLVSFWIKFSLKMKDLLSPIFSMKLLKWPLINSLLVLISKSYYEMMSCGAPKTKDLFGLKNFFDFYAEATRECFSKRLRFFFNFFFEFFFCNFGQFVDNYQSGGAPAVITEKGSAWHFYYLCC